MRLIKPSVPKTQFPQFLHKRGLSFIRNKNFRIFLLSQFKGQNDEKVSRFIFNKRVGVNGVIERMDALTTPLNWQRVRLGDIANYLTSNLSAE
ncbi:hypothetical protein Neuguinea66_08890 [Helicobacter pylori]